MMAPRPYDANHAFGLEILHVISTDPAFATLSQTLILKGGAALLHGYQSGRATRRDLDFGIFADIGFDTTIVDVILVRLDDWQPIREATRDEHESGIAIPIRFVHPRTGQSGAIELQVSRRVGTVPPRLQEKVRRLASRTESGEPFTFLVMPLEEIVGEKAIRCFNPRKGPREEDLYDLGFIEQIGFVWTEADWVFSALRRLEGKNFPFPQQGIKIDNITIALDTTDTAMRIKGSNLYEPYVSLDQIKERIRWGAALAKKLGKV